MNTLLQPTTILLLFVLVRAGDLAISAANGRDFLRAIVYGFTALLALIAIIISFLH